MKYLFTVVFFSYKLDRIKYVDSTTRLGSDQTGLGNKNIG